MPSSILLIDDSPGECELFRQALTQSGYKGRLEITDGSRAAMTYLNDHVLSDEPGLILLDLKLQGERGVDVLKQPEAGCAACAHPSGDSHQFR
jgi:DNA-binding response OmpR family regulator